MKDYDDEPWLDTTPDRPATAKPSTQVCWVVHMNQAVGASRGLREGFVCVGWVEAGDLSAFRSRERLKSAFDSRYPGQPPGRIAHWAGDAERFLEMSIGDLFVYPVKGDDHVWVGEVTGHYRFAGSDADLVADDAASVRNVRWIAQVPRKLFSPEALKCFDSEHTVHSCAGYRAEVLRLVEGLRSRSSQ